MPVASALAARCQPFVAIPAPGCSRSGRRCRAVRAMASGKDCDALRELGHGRHKLVMVQLQGIRGGGKQQPDGAAAWIEEHLGERVAGTKFAGGSSWSSAYIYTTQSGRRLFVKTALGRDADSMFRGEAEGLRAMHATGTIRVPEVFHYGPLPGSPGGGALKGGGSFIVMEYLDLGGRCDQGELGRQVARMHLATPQHDHAHQFGFACDNTIGGTPQPNPWTDSWVDFFREHRLRHQLRLARNSRLDQLAEPLLRPGALEKLFEGVEVRPSVLHGDLWSGNIAALAGMSEPVIFDPATYYGHHEAEWGMSWCAGLGGTFWTEYHKLVPRAPGFEARADLYELYHKLNHYNLFGSGYLGDCERLLSRLVKRVG